MLKAGEHQLLPVAEVERCRFNRRHAGPMKSRSCVAPSGLFILYDIYPGLRPGLWLLRPVGASELTMQQKAEVELVACAGSALWTLRRCNRQVFSKELADFVEGCDSHELAIAVA